MKATITFERKSKPFPRDWTPFFVQVKDYMIASTQRKIKSGITPPNAPLTQSIKRGSKTLRDNGQLMSSISGASSARQASVGTNRKYAKLLHYGGTVKPKKAKYLWIPAGSYTRTLMRRYGHTPRRMIQGLKQSGWKTWYQGKTFWGRAKSGKVNRMLFILKKSVKIPARPFLKISAKDWRVIRLTMRKFIKSGGKIT